ncbi:MAG: hypothetical protein NC111_04520 [Bacteroides sp.]|nr:hypothetical protein [Bacteroides sp.]MCM1413067.1 hypothetical protein [Bacteroides sp.]MCM1471773.1 hypothetical protein [Bacteroides sp.]
MLPLWIIDLRDKSDRRDIFERLIGQIDHVHINRECPIQQETSRAPESDAAVAGQYHENADQNAEAVDPDVNGSMSQQTIHEQIEQIDQKNADKNSIVIGDYWWYSCMQDYFYGVTIGDNAEQTQAEYDEEHIRDRITEDNSARTTAEKLYKFQSDLVVEGQKFIRRLRASNAHPDIKINVVVLGDLSEEFTRIVFPSIAAILQKEKGRMLPHHIHQGMEVIGMLYIPSDINTREVRLRRSMKRTLTEIDVQYRVDDIRGYDHMMFYQDVQNRTECSYRILNDEQLAQYLLQCLVHLYLACNDSHPLLSGTASADVFYFSMGCASVHYDTENEDHKGRRKIFMEMIRALKSEGDDRKESKSMEIIKESDYSPESFFDMAQLGTLEYDDIEEEEPSPHPIKNFLAKYLKRYYYNLHLKFFTTNMMRRIVDQMQRCTRASLEAISVKCKEKYITTQKTILDSLRKELGSISANEGGIPAIIRAFKELQDKLSSRKSEIQDVLQQKFWRKIEEGIPSSVTDRFIDYHEAYVADVRLKNNSARQLEMKKQAVNELNGILSRESTILSRICRGVILGIMCAAAGVPMLNALSPHVIDLGDVRQYSLLWSIGLFCVPAAFELLTMWRYNRKKNRAISNLQAMYLHDAYARVANRIESEIVNFYDKVIALSDRYIARCEDIRREVGRDIAEEDLGKPLFPESMFNQPLIAGRFGNATLLPEKESDDAEVLVNYIRYKLSELTKVEYFLLINQNHNIVTDLFRDVKVCENLERRIDDNGEEILLTKEQQERELDDLWIEHRETFHSDLQQAIVEALLPREDATVGEKLHHYCVRSHGNAGVLEPMIEYAATNGEVTSSSDMEYTDVKMNNKNVVNYILPFVSSANNQMQTDKYNRIYGKYIFVTRWRCFDLFNLNRILPTEDFDEKIRRTRVYEAELKEKEKNMLKHRSAVNTAPAAVEPHDGSTPYSPKISSLLLWALCPDGSSSEWFRLFDSEFFAEAFNDKNMYRQVLNVDD